MKTSILMTAAAALALLAPSAARAEMGGTIGGALAALDSDDDAYENFIGVGGVALADIGGDWSGQFRAASLDMTTYEHSHFYTLVEFGINRQFENFTLGGFVGQLNDDGDGGWTYGIGARTNFDRFTIAGSIGAASERQEEDGAEYSNVSLEGGMALTPRLHLGVVGSWSDVDDTDVDTYGADLHYQATPMFGIGAFYRTSDLSYGYEVEAVGLSFSVNLGDDVRDRYVPGSDNLLYDAMSTH